MQFESFSPFYLILEKKKFLFSNPHFNKTKVIKVHTLAY